MVDLGQRSLWLTGFSGLLLMTLQSVKVIVHWNVGYSRLSHSSSYQSSLMQPNIPNCADVSLDFYYRSQEEDGEGESFDASETV